MNNHSRRSLYTNCMTLNEPNSPRRLQGCIEAVGAHILKSRRYLPTTYYDDRLKGV